jgi:hypothetical protein
MSKKVILGLLFGAIEGDAVIGGSGLGYTINRFSQQTLSSP